MNRRKIGNVLRVLQSGYCPVESELITFYSFGLHVELTAMCQTPEIFH